MAQFPGDLETQYRKAFGKFMDTLNKQYMLLVRELLKDGDGDFVRNVDRRNAFNRKKFLLKLRKIKEKAIDSKLFKSIFGSMESVMSRIDRKVIKDIKSVFRKKKFFISEERFKGESNQLKNAIELNVDLITTITDKHTENLEKAVMKAVMGGSNFDDVVDEVLKQSKKGKAYAEMVARDQVAKVHASVLQERAEVSGFPGYIWQATNDGKTRISHAVLHDTYHEWQNPPLVKGEKGQPDRNLHPGEDFNCRCIAVPAFEPQ